MYIALTRKLFFFSTVLPSIFNEEKCGRTVGWVWVLMWMNVGGCMNVRLYVRMDRDFLSSINTFSHMYVAVLHIFHTRRKYLEVLSIHELEHHV